MRFKEGDWVFDKEQGVAKIKKIERTQKSRE